MFPKWTNQIRTVAGAGAVVGLLYVGSIMLFGFSPQATDVGYQPRQPVPYSHALHPGKLGIDCRYCHNTVEYSSQASIPPTQTCIGCHTNIKKESPLLELVRDSATSGMPVMWVRVHDLPDYAYFNHSAHVRRGVGCVECHGRIDRMDVVYQDQMLSMQWCLDCHRNPDPHLRPPALVTQMDWEPPSGESRAVFGAKLRKQNNINPPTDCSTCHR